MSKEIRSLYYLYFLGNKCDWVLEDIDALIYMASVSYEIISKSPPDDLTKAIIERLP